MMTEARISESNLAEVIENGTLTEYEAKLIRKIDIDGKGVTEVAGEEGKSKSTISLQHSAALKKIRASIESEKKNAATGELAADVFRLLDQQKPQSHVVTKLRVDPEEVRRLANLDDDEERRHEPAQRSRSRREVGSQAIDGRDDIGQGECRKREG
jgi:hypothetical protein